MEYIKEKLLFIEKPTHKLFKDIEGLKFNRLIVLGYAGKFLIGKQKRYAEYWKCLCECGNIKIINGQSLIRNLTKSCGCLRNEKVLITLSKDLTNKKFGYLLVLYRNGNKNNQVLWKCQCDCGNFVNVNTNKLNSGHNRSCGCRSRGSQTHGTIYGIYDNQNNLVYVGQTTKLLNNRLKNHLSQSYGNLKNWLLSIDYKPTIKPLIDNIPIMDLNRIEKETINNYAKEVNLLNIVHNNLK